MGIYYFDSSAIVKLYVTEPGSQWVEQIVNPLAPEAETALVMFAAVGITETAAAIARRWRMGQISDIDRRIILSKFLFDCEQTFRTIKVIDRIILQAVQLTQQFPLRGYDAVHLAAALYLRKTLQSNDADSLVFVSSDKKLLEAASACGLQTETPGALV